MEHAISDQPESLSRASTGVDLQRWLELLAILVITVSILGLAAARLGAFDALPIWVVCVLLTYGYHRVTASSPRTSIVWVPAWHVALVLGVGLLFRLAPYAWILGGQDQGVYVNMAMELARTGGLEPVDHVLAQIVDPAMQEIYRNGNYGSAFLPGVYSTSDGLVFQFYHLFPVWLAMFGDGLGATAAVYGLTFLSLLSLLFFHRVAHLVTGSATAGLIAGLLLAVNPLHAFFSKFPVTEVPTLAFSLMSFALLLAYWRAPAGRGDKRLLAISAAAMGLLFMTRISGFMYMPFLYVLSLALVLFERDSGRRGDMLMWCAAVVGLYAFSVLYGLTWSAPYSNDIYRLSFQPLLGADWKAYVGILVVVAMFGWAAVWLAAQKPTSSVRMQKLVLLGAKMLPVVIALCVAITLYKTYRFGYTDAYAADPWYGLRWNLAQQGLRSVFSTSLAASAVYLSPFILLAFFGAAWLATRGGLLKILLFFLVGFTGYLLVLQWRLPYQPYYARYLLSEFVPYLILFVVCAWAAYPKNWLRSWFTAALVVGGIWGFALSAMQIGKQEHGGVVESIDQLVRNVDHGDVLLVERALGGNLGTRLVTTLIYTYGFDVVRVSNTDLANDKYLGAFAEGYDDVFLLIASNGGDISDFKKVDSTRFINEKFVQGASPPTRIFMRDDIRVDTYEYAPPEPLGYSSTGSAGVEFLEGWSHPEIWGTWTSGTSARIRLDMDEHADWVKGSMLEVSGRVYSTGEVPAQRIRVLIEGELAIEREITYPVRKLSFSMPITGVLSEREVIIEIQTPDAVSPASLGHSSDARTIAFGLESIRVVPPEPTP